MKINKKIIDSRLVLCYIMWDAGLSLPTARKNPSISLRHFFFARKGRAAVLGKTGGKTRRNELKKPVFILFFSMILMVLPLFGDTIIMKNGERVEGRVKEIIDGQVGIEAGNRLYYVPFADVERILYSEKKEGTEETRWGVIIAGAVFCLLAFVLAVWGRSV